MWMLKKQGHAKGVTYYIILKNLVKNEAAKKPSKNSNAKTKIIIKTLNKLFPTALFLTSVLLIFCIYITVI